MKQEWPAVNTKVIVGNVELVLSTGDITRLDKKTYEFIILHMGFIAHYNLSGFQGVYRDLREFTRSLQTGEMSRDLDYNLNWAEQYRRQNDYGRAYHDSVADTIRDIALLARKYEVKIEIGFSLRQRATELTVARNILLKYNIKLPEELKEEQ